MAIASVKWLVAKVGFSLGEERFDEQVPVPEGQVRPRDLVHTAHLLAEAIVDRSVRSVHRRGQVISCRKGCGACCRQVVPVSQPEARHLAELVEAMPEPRRSVVQGRFANARARLASTDLPARFQRAGELDDGQRQGLAVDYFHQGIACPFLEDESCSIYADRPLVCREYLVTTPAENCAQPTVEPVVRIPLPGRVSLALGQLEPTSAERSAWWMPLVMAPNWAAEHPDRSSPRPSFEVLRDLVTWLTRTSPS